MTIWKYPIEITDVQSVPMREHAKILTVQMQGTTACLWALVNPHALDEARTIDVFGTGHPINRESRRYIGTIQIDALVFHVFERVDEFEALIGAIV